MAPSVISARRSSREIAFSISEIRAGSNQTRLTPHFSTDATMRFWLATSLILLHPCLGCLGLGFCRCLGLCLSSLLGLVLCCCLLCRSLFLGLLFGLPGLGLCCCLLCRG